MINAVIRTKQVLAKRPVQGFGITRRDFALLSAGGLLCRHIAAEPPLKALAVVAHPDDEYAFAATAYRITHDFGGTVDQVVITNGEAGYRYSLLAEQIYGVALTDEKIGRANLPEIRRQETIGAGRILGIRHHYFLNQKDAGYTLDADEMNSVWDRRSIGEFLAKLLASEDYGVVLTLLPAPDTHGHHKAVAILTIEAILALPEDRRPLVLGAEPASSRDPVREFVEVPGKPWTRAGADIHEFNRAQSFGFRSGLSYQIIANWVIAEHKSQGLFQMDAGRHDLERFWRFEASGAGSQQHADQLFSRLQERRPQ